MPLQFHNFNGKNLHLVGCATVCGKSEVYDQGNDMQHLTYRYRLIGWKLIYLSEDLIDCKFGTSARKEDWKTKENLSLGDEILNFKDYSYCFSLEIDICFKTTNEKLTGSISRSFNDKTTSDFIVKCHDKEFHVHQYILKQQSEYFNRLLNNNFVESENKSVAIDDFEPEIVEILLRYLYTGAVFLQEKMGIVQGLLDLDGRNSQKYLHQT